jgi:hypothetical protein
MDDRQPSPGLPSGTNPGTWRTRPNPTAPRLNTTATPRHLAMSTGRLRQRQKASNHRLDRPRSLMDDPQNVGSAVSAGQRTSHSFDEDCGRAVGAVSLVACGPAWSPPASARCCLKPLSANTPGRCPAPPPAPNRRQPMCQPNQVWRVACAVGYIACSRCWCSSARGIVGDPCLQDRLPDFSQRTPGMLSRRPVAERWSAARRRATRGSARRRRIIKAGRVRREWPTLATPDLPLRVPLLRGDRWQTRSRFVLVP